MNVLKIMRRIALLLVFLPLLPLLAHESGFPAETLKKVFLVHGEPEGASTLQAAIQKEYGIETVVPGWGEIFELK